MLKHKIYWGLIVIFILFSCVQYPEELEYDWKIPTQINSLEEAIKAVEDISYDYSNKVRLPDEVYLTQLGDCKSSSLFFAYILKGELGLNSYICTGKYKESYYHAWVLYDGIFYECTDGCKEIDDLFNYILLKKYSCDAFLKHFLEN